MKEDIAVQALKEVKEVFDKAGIKFWLICGTLLGAIRDGKIIEYDTDIDLATWHDNVDKIVSVFPELKKRGFNVFLDFNYDKNYEIGILRPGCGIEVSLFRLSGDNAWKIAPSGENIITRYLITNLIFMLSQRVYATKPTGKFVAIKYCVSLLPFKRYLCKMVWSVWEKIGGKFIALVVPKHFFEKLKTIEFYGMKFNVPFEAEKYLEYVYGADWRTPRKEWDTRKSDGSVVYPAKIEDFFKS